jgi:hypothetical protein
MPQEPTQLRAHIREEGENLKSNIEEIETRVRNALDWRIWYRKNTALALGGVAAGGFALALLIPKRESSESRSYSGFTEGAYRGPESAAHAGPTRVRQVVDTALAAAFSLAADKVQEVLSQAVPGFRQHYNEAKRRRGDL